MADAQIMQIPWIFLSELSRDTPAAANAMRGKASQGR